MPGLAQWWAGCKPKPGAGEDHTGPQEAGCGRVQGSPVAFRPLVSFCSAGEAPLCLAGPHSQEGLQQVLTLCAHLCSPAAFLLLGLGVGR